MHAPPSYCLSWKRKVLSFKHTALAPLVSPAKTTIFLEEAHHKTSIRDVRNTNSTSARAHIVDIAADHRCRHRATRCGGALVAPRSFSFQFPFSLGKAITRNRNGCSLGLSGTRVALPPFCGLSFVFIQDPLLRKWKEEQAPGVRQGRNKAHCRW